MKLFGKLLELVILDYDGVVLDLMASYWTILKSVAKAMDLPLEPVRQYREGHYNGTRRGSPKFSAVVRECWPHLSEAEAMAYYWRFRNEEKHVGYPPVPGSVDAVGWFRERGVAMALCTMNDERAMDWKLKYAGLDRGWFASVATRERAGYEKPDPRILDPIFSDIPVRKEHAVYIGDWYADVTVARSAGVPFVAVLSGGIPRHAFLREGVPPERIVGSLADLPKLITE